MGRVGVLVHHGLGDVIMATKSILTLHSCFPEHQIYLILKSNVERDYINMLDVNFKFNTIVLDYKFKFNRRLLVLQQIWQLKKMKFDYLLSIHAANTVVGNIFSLLIGSKIRIGPPESLFYSHKIDKFDGQHKQDYYFNFVRKFAEIISKENLETVNSIKINKTKLNKYNLGLTAKDYIIITPGSSPFDTFKRWSEKKYIKLISMLLKKTKFNIVILGTKSDHPIMLPIYRDYEKERRVKFVDNFSLSQSFHLISNCYLLISACTSSLHIGSLFDINMVSIYGPTNPSFTGPISKNNRVVSMDYKCSPCYRNSFNKGCSSMKCIDDISVQMVYNAVKDFIDKNDIIPQKIKTTTNFKYFVRK